MIRNVNFLNTNQYLGSQNKNCSNSQSPSKVSFGYQQQYQSPHPIRDFILTMTDDVIGLAGFNTALWAIQKFVNNDILIGKINQHFTKNITNKEQLELLARIMRRENHLDGKGGNPFVDIIKNAPLGRAYYSPEYNHVVVGKDKFSALFHELGHACEENNTKLLKLLQGGRGHYTELSLILYTLLAQRQKSNNNGSLNKSDAIIPLLAFSPELITEGAASLKGLNFLKTKIGEGADKISKATYKNISRSYATCFMTYLFIPVSIILLDLLRNGANNARQRKMIVKKNQFYA